jgi:hypothetical protein
MNITSAVRLRLMKTIIARTARPIVVSLALHVELQRVLAVGLVLGPRGLLAGPRGFVIVLLLIELPEVEWRVRQQFSTQHTKYHWHRNWEPLYRNVNM